MKGKSMLEQDHPTRRDNTVSQAHYALIMERCPALRENEPYKLAFQYIYFADGPQVWDKNTGKKKVPSKLVASWEGEKALRDWRGGRYSAMAFWRRYQAQVSPGLRLSGYSHEKGLCRIVLNTGEQDIIDLWLDENDTKRRYFLSGKAYNKTSQYTKHQEMLAQHEQLEDETLYPAQTRVMRYMNNLPYATFRRLLDEHYWDAVRVSHEQKLVERHRVCLKNVNDYPIPLYSPRPDNARLYAPSSLQQLPGSMRRAIAPHWIDLDIVSSLGGIAAKAWDVEGLYDLLVSGKSLWEVLIEQLGMQDWPYEIVKDIVKGLFCSTFFHMGVRKLNKQYANRCEDEGIEPAGIKFTQAPIIAEALRARDRIARVVREDGGCDGAYGPMDLPSGLELPSFLTHVTQTYELYMIDAVFVEAEQSTDFRVMLYSFDGVSIEVDEGHERDVIQRLQRGVNARASELGIPTRLAVDNG
jgi:hypothetical protein